MTLNLNPGVQFYQVDIFYYKLEEERLIRFCDDFGGLVKGEEYEARIKQFKTLKPIEYSIGVGAWERFVQGILGTSNSNSNDRLLCHSLVRSEH